LPISLYAGSSPAAKAYAAFAGEVIEAFLPERQKQERPEKVKAKR
jgi:hypothetical protein